MISGGRPDKAAAASLSIAALALRAHRYRGILARRPNHETESLVSDFEDAIEALKRLERPAEAGSAPRAAEYRRLIAELDAEIVAALDAAPQQ